MVVPFLEPEVSSLLVARYEARRKESLEGPENEEGLKAQAGEEGAVTREQ